ISLSRSIMPLLNRVRMLFDLNADPHLIMRHLGDTASAHPGLRVPGSFNRFETAIRAILGQQVSVKAASTLMSRFCLAFGDKLETPIEGLSIVFPSAKKIAALSQEEIISIGLTSARAKTLISFAQAVATDSISLELAIDPEDRIRQLKELPGIGEWTAQYLAMRVLNWPDAFPAGDLGIRKALKIDNEKTVLAHAEKWRPWRSYAAMHLWKTLEI
ncbi:MAG: DNA-3-methyladenine glycosylase, partial [Candidatus Obscuribacterales bacterium]|nr:DNA-3-methyladenine glycosylase [Candidatus Obscuribacterales bacterium]